MRKIGVVGLGLIGGSIALSLKANGFYVVGVETDADSLSFALKNNIIDSCAEIDSLYGCESVFVCVPVGYTRETVEKVVASVGEETIVTDVASVKGILQGVRGRIVGGHPMAGTEKSGIEAARAHLFENAFYAIVKYDCTLDVDVEYLKNLVRLFKANPVVMTVDEHDARASKVSHLPHMTAYALSEYALKEDGFVGTGFMDSTRIAASSADFWTNVAFLNRENLIKDMDGFLEEFGKIRKAICDGDRDKLKELIESARKKREALTYRRVYLNEYCLDLDVKDEVGAISKVSKLLADNDINISGIQIINSREGVGGALRISVKSESDYDRAIALLGLKDKR